MKLRGECYGRGGLRPHGVLHRGTLYQQIFSIFVDAVVRVWLAEVCDPEVANRRI